MCVQQQEDLHENRELHKCIKTLTTVKQLFYYTCLLLSFLFQMEQSYLTLTIVRSRAHCAAQVCQIKAQNVYQCAKCTDVMFSKI